MAFVAQAQPARLISALDGSNHPAAGGGGDSYGPVLSPDGRFVVFASTGEAAPDTYQTHWVPGQSVATGIVAEVLQGLNGVVPESFYNNSSTTVTVSFDVSGYFAATFY